MYNIMYLAQSVIYPAFRSSVVQVHWLKEWRRTEYRRRGYTNRAARMAMRSFVQVQTNAFPELLLI